MQPRPRWILAATVIASSMTFLDATVVNVALPALQADLHATITDVQWVVEAYALFLGGLILVGGSMGDQSGRIMDESGDPARTGRVDWTGAGLAILGLCGVVFGLLELPPLGAGHPLVIAALAVGTLSLVLFVVVERRTSNPMLPLGLFRSR